VSAERRRKKVVRQITALVGTRCDDDELATRETGVNALCARVKVVLSSHGTEALKEP
jgi:hypothetical protein